MRESRVGSKGELFPPKEIRESLGLRARTRVVYTVDEGRLVVEPVPSLEEVFHEPKPVETTLREFHSFRRELSKRVES